MFIKASQRIYVLISLSGDTCLVTGKKIEGGSQHRPYTTINYEIIKSNIILPPEHESCVRIRLEQKTGDKLKVNCGNEIVCEVNMANFFFNFVGYKNH